MEKEKTNRGEKRREPDDNNQEMNDQTERLIFHPNTEKKKSGLTCAKRRTPKGKKKGKKGQDTGGEFGGGGDRRCTRPRGSKEEKGKMATAGASSKKRNKKGSKFGVKRGRKEDISVNSHKKQSRKSAHKTDPDERSSETNKKRD